MCSKMYLCTKINTSKFLFNLDTVDEEPLFSTANIPIPILFFIINHTNHMLWINIKLIMILISNNGAESTKLLY